jgi:signal transduction histidine kinase
MLQNWHMWRNLLTFCIIWCSFAELTQGAATAGQVLRLDTANLSPTQSVKPAITSPTAVQLPDSWNKVAREGTLEYALPFTLPSVPAESWGLYVPRAGNRFSIRLNGQNIAQVGEFDDLSSDHAQKPHFFFLPKELLQTNQNQLMITVQGEKARYAGLSSVFIGPLADVRPMFVWREILQTWGSFSIVIVALIFGLISAGLAFTTRDHLFTIFAAACLFSAVRTSYAVVTRVPIPYPFWQLLIDTCYAGYLVCLCLFSVRALKIQRKWVYGLTAMFLLGTFILVPAYAFGQNALARQIWTFTMIAYALCLSWLVIGTWFRERTPNGVPLVIAATLSVFLALYDHALVFYSKDGYGSFAVARYSLLFFLVAMGWFLITHYADQVKIERNYKKQLATELQNKTLELYAQFQKQEQLILEVAQNEEHKKLVQDLHDGMGLQLSTLLVMVEKGGFGQAELTSEVRTAIEQMRMLVDGAQTFDGNFDQVLGHIRYRIESRLRRCNIKLNWHVDYADLHPTLSDKATMALQRLIFELCTNVIKHSKANEVQLKVTSATHETRTLQIEFSDDGTGLLLSEPNYGSGAATLRRRLDELKARAVSTSLPNGGLQYQIFIPC